MGQMGGQPPQPSPQQPQSLNMNVSSENRAKFAGFLEGVRSRSATSPIQPPMMPPQPPMMMNMGGMVDVFDPRYMNQGGFVFTTGEGGKINTTPVVDENTGRIVSKILSNQAMEDMAKATEGLNEPEIPLSQQIQNKVIADESERNVPFTQTVIESDDSEPVNVTTPVLKPNLPMSVDTMRIGEDDISSNISPPLPKPEISQAADPADPIDAFKGVGAGAIDELFTKDIDDLGTEEREIKDIDDLGTEDRVLDTGDFNRFGGGVERQALIEKPVEGIYDEATGEYTFRPIDVFDPFADEREAASKRLSPEGLKQIARMVTEGEKLSGPEVDVFNMLNISPMGETYGEEMGEAQTGTVGIYPETPKKDLTVDDIAKLILASQTGQPLRSSGEEKQSGIMKLLNRFILGPRTQMGMNDGGIVQGFRNGGVTVGSNFTNKDLKQAKEIVERVNKASSQGVKNKILDRSRPEVETIARGMIAGYDPDFGEEMGSENLAFAPMPNIDAGERAASYMLSSPVNQSINRSDDDLRIDEDRVKSTGPVYDAFLKSQESPFAPVVNKIGESIFGKSPYDLFYTTQQNLKPDSMQSRIARDRQLDRERAERKLAEEQRLRDMIQGMLPAPVEATQTPTAPIAEAPTPVAPTNPLDVVVPSTRVPNFQIPALPTLPATSPLLPQGISPELLRNLFNLQGVPVTAMQKGGSVNTLDNAIDNFLSSVR